MYTSLQTICFFIIAQVGNGTEATSVIIWYIVENFQIFRDQTQYSLKDLEFFFIDITGFRSILEQAGCINQTHDHQVKWQQPKLLQ